MINIKIKQHCFKKIKLTIALMPLFMIIGCTNSTFNLILHPNELSNNGQPFYVLIKENSIYDFINSSIANVYKDYLNDDVFSESLLIYPENGQKSVSISNSKKDGVSVYFLFQKSPRNKVWKYYINSDKQKDMILKITSNNMIEAL
jgi:hypothetical protein